MMKIRKIDNKCYEKIGHLGFLYIFNGTILKKKKVQTLFKRVEKCPIKLSIYSSNDQQYHS